MARFEIAVPEGTGEMVIRLVQKEKRKKDREGRRYTPMG